MYYLWWESNVGLTNGLFQVIYSYSWIAHECSWGLGKGRKSNFKVGSKRKQEVRINGHQIALALHGKAESAESRWMLRVPSSCAAALHTWTQGVPQLAPKYLNFFYRWLFHAWMSPMYWSNIFEKSMPACSLWQGMPKVSYYVINTVLLWSHNEVA